MNWTYKLYKTSDAANDTIPSYKIDNILERYNETLLKMTNLALKENKDVMEKTNLN